MALDDARKELILKTLMDLGEADFKSFRFYTHLPESVRESGDRVDISNELVKKHGEKAPDETVKILKKIGNNNLAEMLCSEMLEIKVDDQIARLKGELQHKLQVSYNFVPEGNTEHCKQEQPLANVYTELDVTYGADIGSDEWREVLRTETCAAAKAPIRPCDIFKSADGSPRPIRTLLTVGLAGIGKTFLVQKFVRDWAGGNTNQDVHFIFPLTFHELNTDKGKSFTLAQLIRRYVCESRHMSEETLNNIFAGLQTSGNRDYLSSGIKILFVLDGLDECSFKMDLKNEMKMDIDVTKAYPLEVLLAHLLKRNLLPCARVWITTRPATVSDIPSDLIDTRIEVRGFSDSQRLEYFRKRFPNEERVIKHIQRSRYIFIMCQMPAFCWITATVLQDHFKDKELPTMLTNIFSEFLSYHLVKSRERQTMESIYYVKNLAKLAFRHTMKKNQLFYEEDLVDSGFDYGQAAKHCGLFTEVFREVGPLRRIQQGKMFQFLHVTIQEYLAAMYVMMSLFHDNKNVLADSERSLKGLFMPFKQMTITEVHQSALQKASQSDGNLDLFLRFLFGLSLPCDQELVRKLLKAPADCGQSISDTVKWIKTKIEWNTPEKNINLFYCLNEMKDDSLLKQIQQDLRSGCGSWCDMTNDMWSGLAFSLVNDDETMNSFDLKKYSSSALGLEMLLSVVKASQKSLLDKCNLDKHSCRLLASILSSPSNLRHLDLSLNNLSDEGIEILSEGLASQHCLLQVLDLSRCKITKRGCVSLAKALRSNPSHLQELDLNYNNLSDEGVKSLSEGLASPGCILKVLRLERCKITKRGCVSLAETLKLKPSHLQKLDLSCNDLWDEGVEVLSKGLASQQCILQVLELERCKMTKQGCVSLAEALKLNPANLQELALNFNDLSDEGVEVLSTVLAIPDCTLKVLELERCKITKQGCVSLAEVLNLNPSHLQELALNFNDLSDEGVEILSNGLSSPGCILKVLELSCCKITKVGCVPLTKALKLNPSHFQELDLSGNDLSDEGVEILSEGLASPDCNLKVLELFYCKITKRGCVSLADALKLKNTHLEELKLSGNDLSDEGVENILKVLDSPNCMLKVLELSDCKITKQGCVHLAEMLKFNPFHLRELDLSGNDLSDEGFEILSEGLASPHCILKVLRLERCRITERGWLSFAGALKLNPSNLQELVLKFNVPEEEEERSVL
ncbi:NACHT, LRR and PYD domains-containing protein 14-like [Corythoichthys intestinalis]|uniref:NACHT, LRR and PYD domains-containing protein 14-like n=1 Tax=Corythoichthys intestinalis TaxID=161448 RepID=UPI0025A67E6A|nr:NACHT, LRR and PYD domains-containing protein 14-like [Corythoichthys intestinalis]